MKRFVNRKLNVILLSLVLVIGSFFVAPAASADWASSILSTFLGLFISALGLILILAIKALIYIAQYQDFLNSEAVILGWVIVRDICNMFFVVILMIIAFGTILNIPDYSYKKWLPKLILFAILINFSKTICGLLIDVTQVVMLTFVNAFKDIGGANLTEMLGISSILTFEENSTDPSYWTIVGAYVLGMVYLLVAIVVIFTMVMILAMRLVMIWIYVILSPAAYLMSAVPGGQSYASKWWDEFTKNLIVGPVLAFFIWLSLASLNADKTIQNLGVGADVSNEMKTIAGNAPANEPAAGPTKAGQPSALIKFVVGIGMLVGGLMVSQQIGGAAGNLAGKGMNALQKGRVMAVGAGAGVLKWGGRRMGDLRDVASEKLGVDLNLKEVWKRRNEQAEGNRQLRLQRIRKKTLETAEGTEDSEGKRPGYLRRKAALLSTGDVGWQNIVDKKFGVLRDGSPARAKKALDAIKDGENNKAALEGEKASVASESSRMVTMSEYREKITKASGLKKANKDLLQEKIDIESDSDYKRWVEEDNNRTISAEDKKKLDSKKEQIDKIDSSIEANSEEIKTLRRPMITLDKIQEARKRIKQFQTENEGLRQQRDTITGDEGYKSLVKAENDGSITRQQQLELDQRRNQVKKIDGRMEANDKRRNDLENAHIIVKNQAEKNDMEMAGRAEITTLNVKLSELDKKIKDYTEVLRKNKLSEIDTARANIDAQMEGEAAKKISSFTNPDQLVGVFKEALDSKDLGLMSATYKKLTKTGNYNELHRELGIGTGYEGMVEMSKVLQRSGGMSQQDSRALIAEIGEIAKGIGHMEAFGAMSMNKAGQWEETGRDNQEAAILSEKSKIQVQKFVRDINRLGAGTYETGKPHTAENWKLSSSTIALLASKDEKYAQEMKGTGNMNMIQFIGSNSANLKALRDNGAKEVAKLIEDIMKKTKSNVADPLNAIRNLKLRP